MRAETGPPAVKPEEAEGLTLEEVSISFYLGSGQVLVGLLDFKSSGGQTMSVVGSIPMHFRQTKKARHWAFPKYRLGFPDKGFYVATQF